jgi:hypothetical protein
MFLVFIVLKSDQIKEDETSRTYSTYGGEEKYLRDFSEQIVIEEKAC